MTSITFRTDREVDRALAELMTEGSDRSQTIREAILIAHRLKEASSLRAEADDLVGDSQDVAESRAVLAEMESLRAW